jgi:hypothetical protein
MSRVLNKYKDKISSDAVYIGRGSKWGNPFVIDKDGGRIDVCDKYELWFCDQPELMASLDELKGKDLVCFCAPKKCHGDFLLRLANI